MARAYSLDLRERVVGAVAAGQSCRSVAKTFMVSVASVVKWSQRQRVVGSPAAQAGHIGLGPGFIDEDQPPGVDEPLIGSPSFAVATDVRAILLARDKGLF